MAMMSEPDFGFEEPFEDETFDADPGDAPPLEADPADWQEQHLVVEDPDEER